VRGLAVFCAIICLTGLETVLAAPPIAAEAHKTTQSEPVVYVSLGSGGSFSGGLYAYAQSNFSLQYQIAIQSPFEIAVDQSENLYLTSYYSPNISVYAYGATSPYSTLFDVGSPQAVAVAADGTVYAANYYNLWNRDLSGQIAVYAPGQQEPEYTLPVPGAQFIFGLCIDQAKNLYVLFKYPPGTTAVREFPKGSLGPSRDLGLALQTGDDWGIVVDNAGNLLVTAGGGIEVFPPGATQPSQLIAAGSAAVSMAFTSDWSKLYVLGVGGVFLYSYPAGTLLAQYPIAHEAYGASGIATSPAPPQ